MLLTLNQTLFLVLSIAVVVAIVFLIFFLVQIRRTAREGERALVEIRELAEGLRGIEQKVNARMDDVGKILESSKKTVAGLSEATLFLTTKVVRPASKYWPILFPLIRLGWQQLKKRKEK
jgi:biopolymer transport protein ExbB/TolQ